MCFAIPLGYNDASLLPCLFQKLLISPDQGVDLLWGSVAEVPRPPVRGQLWKAAFWQMGENLFVSNS